MNMIQGRYAINVGELRVLALLHGQKLVHYLILNLGNAKVVGNDVGVYLKIKFSVMGLRILLLSSASLGLLFARTISGLLE